MHKRVQQALTDLFMTVADECDGGDPLRIEIQNEYNRIMKIPAVMKFYGELVDQTSTDFSHLITGIKVPR